MPLELLNNTVISQKHTSIYFIELFQIMCTPFILKTMRYEHIVYNFFHILSQGIRPQIFVQY